MSILGHPSLQPANFQPKDESLFDRTRDAAKILFDKGFTCASEFDFRSALEAVVKIAFACDVDVSRVVSGEESLVRKSVIKYLKEAGLCIPPNASLRLEIRDDLRAKGLGADTSLTHRNMDPLEIFANIEAGRIKPNEIDRLILTNAYIHARRECLSLGIRDDGSNVNGDYAEAYFRAQNVLGNALGLTKYKDITLKKTAQSERFAAELSEKDTTLNALDFNKFGTGSALEQKLAIEEARAKLAAFSVAKRAIADTQSVVNLTSSAADLALSARSAREIDADKSTAPLIVLGDVHNNGGNRVAVTSKSDLAMSAFPPDGMQSTLADRLAADMIGDYTKGRVLQAKAEAKNWAREMLNCRKQLRDYLRAMSGVALNAFVPTEDAQFTFEAASA